MSKEVTYSVVARKNMLKKDDPAKYYAQAQASGDVAVSYTHLTLPTILLV